jgi:PPP family 3-phenylpropionic acid transporter
MREALSARPPWLSLRLAAYYFAVFALVGVAMPYWPVWLESRGLGPVEIGIVLAVGRWVSIGTTPAIAQLADRRGERKRLLVILLSGLFLGYSLYLLTDGFWQILLVSLFVYIFRSAINPVGDSLTLLNASRGYADYGRVRLWGSVSFILTAFLGGEILHLWGADGILWAILVIAAGGVVVGVCLPDSRTDRQPRRRGAFWTLARHPVMVRFIVTMALLSSSHAVLYAFGTIYWRSVGISDRVIGLLWAEGVIVEILLFALAAPIVRRLGPGRMLLLGAVGGVIRWTILGATTDLTLLIFAQALHAATFAAAHLGAMTFITEAAPTGMSATAQSLYNALAMGAAIAITIPLTGPVFEAVGGDAYYLMTVLSAAGGISALFLMRRWDGRRIVLPATVAAT